MHSHNSLSKELFELFRLNPCCNGRCTRTKCSQCLKTTKRFCLNPCCNGRCTRTFHYLLISLLEVSLNPCCIGRCTRTIEYDKPNGKLHGVLILVVMEDALAQLMASQRPSLTSLNPCCNGRCTRTLYKLVCLGISLAS